MQALFDEINKFHFFRGRSILSMDSFFAEFEGGWGVEEFVHEIKNVFHFVGSGQHPLC